MEAIGLTVGVVSLAGLFSTCIDCFELVQRGRYLGKEYLLLETKFTNQRLRLLTWGRACGFTDSDSYDKRLDGEEVRSCIEATLIHLITLFNDGKGLKMKYGLKHDQPGNNVLTVASSALDALIHRSLSSTTNFGQKLHDFSEKVGRTQKNASFKNTVRWAIEDKRKFTELVQHLKDLIDDLEGVTKWLSVSERQREIIQWEVETISDISVLENMEEARWGKVDAVSNAASLRLWKLRDQYLESERGNRPANPDQPSQAAICSTDVEWDDMAEDAHNWGVTAVDTPYQVVHRVSCQHEQTSVFLDTPSYSTWNDAHNQWVLLDTEHPAYEPKSLHLSGRRMIPDLDAYLTQNCQLLFVILRNYRCCHDCDQQKDSGCPAFDQSIYLSSEDFCSALRELSQRTMDLSKFPEFRPGMELRAPYLWYYHSRKPMSVGLNDLIIQAKDNLGVKTLLDVISESMAEEYSTVESLLSRKMISWAYLQYLFVPGDIVIQTHVKGPEHYQAHELISLPRVVRGDDESAYFKVDVHSLAFDGNYQRTGSTLSIFRSQFGKSDGEILPLSSLPVLPLIYAENCSHEYLKNRGRMGWKYRHRQLVSYSGQTADSEDFIHNRRFMIDASMYNQLHSDVGTPTISLGLNDNLGNGTTAPDRPPDSNFLLLLPPTVHGYDMQEHRWRKLLVANIAPVLWNKKAFEQLVLSREKKDLLTAIVTSITSNKNADTSDKDDSLILLFHGGPGTGKSFAAEAVAEYTERPFYRITCSDIGTDVANAERFLQSTLFVRTTWRCVVILDDADVFLEQRSLTDLHRNALVSAFLRFLEHFNGTLILTSNRVGIFDDAFRSRIRFILHFPSLGTENRARIWHNSVDDLRDTNAFVDVCELSNRIPELAEHQMNGREIRNILKTAVQLAHFRKEDLRFAHIREAIDASLEFEKYIKELHGGYDASALARESGIR